MSGYNAEHTAQENDNSEAVIRHLQSKVRDLTNALAISDHVLKDFENEREQLIRAFNAFVDYDMKNAEQTGHAPVVFIENFENILRELRDLKIQGLKMPEHLAHKKFRVEYIIGTTYEVEIEAGDEIEAEAIFEELYEESYGELENAEEIEIIHAIRETREAR